MIGRAVRLGLAVAVVALLAALRWMQVGAVDPAVHSQYFGALRELQAIDDDLDRDLLRVRTGALAQYDVLGQELAELRRLATEAADPPAFVDATARARIAAGVEAFAAALRDKQARVDRFKSDHAVLRNSLVYLPALAAEQRDRALPAATRQAVAGLEHDVLAWVLLADGSLAARIGAQASAWAGAADHDLRLLGEHARVILERKRSSDEGLAAALASCSHGDLDRVYVEYTTAHRKALSVSSRRRTVVGALMMLTIALAAASVIVALRRGARALAVERDKSERLLLNVLPRPIADRLKAGEAVIADDFAQASVLFADIVGFTQYAASVSAGELVRLLNEVFSAFDRLAERHGLEKVKTIGDAYMVVGGLPAARPDHAVAIAEMALGMQAAVEEIATARGLGLRVRVGIHAGPVVAGVIGLSKFTYDLWGDTVNVASRMESHGVPGRVHVSAELQALLASRYVFEDRGAITVKGRGEMRTAFLIGRKPAA